MSKPLARIAVCLAALGMASIAAQAAGPAKGAKNRPAKTAAAVEPAAKVELFPALKAKQLAVRFVPQNAQMGRLFVANVSAKPLSVQLPKSFAGSPVLGQIGGEPQLSSLANTSAAQILGSVIPNGSGESQAMAALNGKRVEKQAPAAEPRVVTIAAGATVQVPVACVCLQYGNPDPQPEIPYHATTLETFTKSPQLQALLDEFASGRLDQPVVQLAAWHFSNGMSWEELAETGYANQRLPEAMRLAELVRRRVAQPPAKPPAASSSAATSESGS